MDGYRTALAVAGLWLAACSSSVAQEDFDARLAEALCEKLVRCGVSHDRDSCKRGQLEVFLVQYGLNTQHSKALGAGRMRYDAEAARECLEKIRTGSCDQQPLSPRLLLEGVGMSADCRFLFGEVADGERCHVSGECGAQSACTAARSSFSCGTCQPRRSEGMESPSPALCEQDLVYVQSTCREPLREGQPCGDSSLYGQEPCAQGLWCDPDTQRCRRPATVGESCDFQTRGCQWNLICIEGVCQVPKGKGATCTAHSGNSFTRAECKQELFCDAEPDASGTCRELLGEGASCRELRECVRGLSCDGAAPGSAQRGTCRRYAQQNEDCTGRVCDLRFYCSESSRTCQPRRQSGESCEDAPDSCVLGHGCSYGICGGGPVPACP